MWLEQGQLWGVPRHRLSGLYAPANAEFSTAPLLWPADPATLTLNADASWQDDGHGTCDEKCQAYIMGKAQRQRKKKKKEEEEEGE